MASPQCENGYTRIANELLDALIRSRVPGQELRVLLAVIRKTYGFGKKEDRISYGQLAKMTGIARQRVMLLVRNCNHRRLLSVTIQGYRKAGIIQLNKDFDQWEAWPKREYTCNHTRVQGVTIEGYRTVTIEGTHKRKKENIKENINTTLPEWLPQDLWKSFLAHRKAIKAPIPQQNAQRVIKKLSKLKDDGYPPEYVIETMIERGWRWYKPEWDHGGKYGNKTNDSPVARGLAQFLNEEDDPRGNE